MENVFSILSVLHIIGGGMGLVAGTVNIVRKKGDQTHRLGGRIFFYGMLTAGATALVMSVMHPSPFLFIVGVFTLYMIATGFRFIRMDRAANNHKPHVIDWLLTAGMTIGIVLFVFMGGKLLLEQQMFGIVPLVFAVISVILIKDDIQYYRGKVTEKNRGMLIHLQRMTGGYIAALTAFLVVNGSYLNIPLPAFVLWLLPTFILTPLIIYWSKKYRVI